MLLFASFDGIIHADPLDEVRVSFERGAALGDFAVVSPVHVYDFAADVHRALGAAE